MKTKSMSKFKKVIMIVAEIVFYIFFIGGWLGFLLTLVFGVF